MPLTDLQLMAHLFRRAGFGATRDELEKAVAKGYEATVEELLHPEAAPPVEEDVLQRYYLDAKESFQLDGAQTGWVYRLINTRRPLEEKMTLFWHGLFATGFNKCDDPRVMTQQIAMFRRHGLGNFRELLVELSRDPAMIFWLDNCESTGGRPQRELRPRAAGAVLDGHRQLPGGRRQSGGAGLHRLDACPDPAAPALRSFRLAVRVSPGAPRRQREDVSRRNRALERRGYRQHHRQTAGDGPLHCPPPV